MKKSNMRLIGQSSEMLGGNCTELSPAKKVIISEMPMTFESVITVSQIIDILLRKTYESAFSKAVNGMLHSYSLEKCENVITEITELFCISHDNGEYPRTDSESVREHLWEVPTEPMPTEIDTCGRGTLNLKKEYKFVMPVKEQKKIRKTTLSRSSANRLSKKMIPTKKEEPPIISYPLYTGKLEDDFEQQIDDMRQNMKKKELEEQEKEKEDQEKLKRLQEYEEKKKNMSYNMTYDVNGNLVDVQELNSFPPLTNRIQQQLVETEGGVSSQKKKRYHSKKKDKEDNLWETELIHMSTARAKHSKKFTATAKVYDYKIIRSHPSCFGCLLILPLPLLFIIYILFKYINI